MVAENEVEAAVVAHVVSALLLCCGVVFWGGRMGWVGVHLPGDVRVFFSYLKGALLDLRRR